MNSSSKQINIPSMGGVFSTKQLGDICNVAIANGVKELCLTNKQTLVAYAKNESDAFEGGLNKLGVLPQNKNITSSLPFLEMAQNTNWVHRGVYLDIIAGIKESTKSISIVDPALGFMPLCDSQINIIASKEVDYWYLVLCLNGKETPPFIWPVLINSEDVPNLVNHLCSYDISQINDLNLFAIQVNNKIEYDNLSFSTPLQLKHQKIALPDGFSTYKNYNFISFYCDRIKISTLDSLVVLCKSKEVKYISITPWKSFIVSTAEDNHLDDWEFFLSVNNIVTGRAFYEKNWKTDQLTKQQQNLKDNLINHLHKKQIRTYGLTFGIENQDNNIYPSILIEEKKGLFNSLLFRTYNLWYAKDFNSNLRQYKSYKKGLSKTELKSNFISLVTNYQKKVIRSKQNLKINKEYNKIETEPIYECQDCLTQYIPSLGDEISGVPANTPFSDLDDNYVCPTCEASKVSFVKMD